MRAICCALACLFAYTTVTAHHTHHVNYRTPAHHTTKEK